MESIVDPNKHQSFNLQMIHMILFVLGNIVATGNVFAETVVNITCVVESMT